jgi:hypothetical protein
MLLLALLFFFYRKYSYFAITVATTVVLTLIGFLFFPGSPSENLVNWIHAFSRYRAYQPLGDSYPYNLGFGRSIVTMFDFLRLDRYTDPSVRTHLVSGLHRYSIWFGLFLVAITTLTMFLRSRGSNRYYPLLAVCVVIAIAPETSYGYYLALMLVPAAFILHDPRDRSPTERKTSGWSGLLDDDDRVSARWHDYARWILISGLALLLVPLVVPIAAIPLLNLQVTTHESVGVLQLLWGPILVVLFLVSVSMALVRSPRAKPEGSGLGSETRVKDDSLW